MKRKQLKLQLGNETPFHQPSPCRRPSAHLPSSHFLPPKNAEPVEQQSAFSPSPYCFLLEKKTDNWSLVEKYRQRPQCSDKTNIKIIMEVPKARVDVLFPFSGFI